MLDFWKILYTETWQALVIKCFFFVLLVARYVDMIANPEVADVFRKRAKVVHLLTLFSLTQMFAVLCMLFFMCYAFQTITSLFRFRKLILYGYFPVKMSLEWAITWKTMLGVYVVIQKGSSNRGIIWEITKVDPKITSQQFNFINKFLNILSWCICFLFPN